MSAVISNIRTNKSWKAISFGILLAAIFISFILGSVIVKAQNNSSTAGTKAHYTNVAVDNGDSLWSIASEYMDSTHYDSIYEYMDELKSLNNMTSDNLFAGENLIVIYYDKEQ